MSAEHRAPAGVTAMSSILPLSEICTERHPDPHDQRERLLQLLADGADIHACDKNGVTALHHAVRFRSVIAVQTLIEHGANVNQACRRSGSTPLHRAVITTGAPETAERQAEATAIIRMLLAAGADPSLTNKHGRKPGDYVKEQSLKDLLAVAD